MVSRTCRFVLLAALCAALASPAAFAAGGAKGPVTITVFARNVGGNGMALGEQGDPVVKEIERRLGIRISVYKEGADTNVTQVLGVMLASNDLADIQYLGDEQKNLTAAIKAGLIIPLDDLIATNAPTIMATPDLKLRVDYDRKHFGVNGKVYDIKLWGGTGVDATPVGGPYIRWDLYKKLGYPSVATTDELVKVLADMQAMEPRTKDGQKVYAVGGFFADAAGWGDWPLMNSFAWERGLASTKNVFWIDVGTQKALPNQLTDLSSAYWQNVSFYYKARKAGLLDPDAATQKYDKYVEKMRAGRYLFVPTGWDARTLKNDLAKAGNPDGAFICLTGPASSAGCAMGWSGFLNGSFYSISKNCKNPAAAMKLLDFVSSPEGTRLLFSGVEGQSWRMVDGKPAWTEAYLNDRKTLDANAMQEKYGGKKYQFFSGYQLNVMSGRDGEIFDLDQSPSFMAQSLTATEKDALKYYGAKTLTGIYLKNRKPFLYMTEYVTWPDKPSEIKAIEGNVTNYMYANEFKCVYAKDDAEYQASQKAFIDGLSPYKADVLYKWYLDAYNANRKELGGQLDPLAKDFQAKYKVE